MDVFNNISITQRVSTVYANEYKNSDYQILNNSHTQKRKQTKILEQSNERWNKYRRRAVAVFGFGCHVIYWIDTLL